MWRGQDSVSVIRRKIIAVPAEIATAHGLSQILSKSRCRK